MADTVNTELIRGHVDTFILRTLVLGDSYPYDILKQISEKTQGRYELKQATLYSCMKRLEKNGLITSYWGDQSDGGRRKYYSLTDLGKELLEKDQAEWEYSRTIINNLLSDKDFDLKNDQAPFDASSLRPLTRRTKAVEEENDEVLVSTPYMLHKDENRQENNPPVSLFDYYQKKQEEDLDNELNKEKQAIVEEKEIAAAAPPILEKPVENKHTELSIEEVKQRDAASRLLQIGNFAKPLSWDPDLDTITPTLSSSDEDLQQSRKSIDDTYITKLDSLYGDADEDIIDNFEVVAPTVNSNNTTELNLIQFNDLRNSMLQQGYRLRLYNRPSELSRKYLKYIYSNKLMRDSYIALFLPLLTIYIITMALKVFDSLAVNILLGIAIVGVPVVATLIWMKNPNRRTRDDYLFSHSILIRTIVMLLSMIIIFLILMFLFDANITETPLKYIISWLLSMMVPLYSIIYQLLLKRKAYYIDK